MFQSIYTAVKQAAVAQKGIQVSTDNIAHINNPNHARQRLEIVNSHLSPMQGVLVGTGSHIERVTDARDPYLDQQVKRSSASLGLAEGQYTALNAIEKNLNEHLGYLNIELMDNPEGLGGSVGLSKSIDDFFGELIEWSASPSSHLKKQMVIAQAERLTDQFNDLGKRLDHLDADLSTHIELSLNEANTILEKIAALNDQINFLETDAKTHALGLRGERQTLIEQLSYHLDCTVSGNDLHSSFVHISILDTAQQPIALVDGSTVPNPLRLNASQVEAGTHPIQLSKGKIAGYITVLQQDSFILKDSLNQLAHQFVISFNVLYNPTQSAHQDFFDPQFTTASTIRLDPNLTIHTIKSNTSGLSEDNSLIQELQNLRLKSFDTQSGDLINGTFFDHYSTLVYHIADRLRLSQEALTFETQLHQTLLETRHNEIGSSYEEIMATLHHQQQSYQASLKVMQICRECIEDFIHII